MVTDMTTHKLDAQNVNVYYDQAHVIRDVSLTIEANTVTAFIGPSGCGKSTFLRLINRMNDYIDGFRKTGTILIDGEDIYDKKVRVEELRKKIGMVFQKPNPFPKSIYENVIYGLRIQGINKKSILDETVERSLRRAHRPAATRPILHHAGFPPKKRRSCSGQQRGPHCRRRPSPRPPAQRQVKAAPPAAGPGLRSGPLD